MDTDKIEARPVVRNEGAPEKLQGSSARKHQLLRVHPAAPRIATAHPHSIPYIPVNQLLIFGVHDTGETSSSAEQEQQQQQQQRAFGTGMQGMDTDEIEARPVVRNKGVSEKLQGTSARKHPSLRVHNAAPRIATAHPRYIPFIPVQNLDGSLGALACGFSFPPSDLPDFPFRLLILRPVPVHDGNHATATDQPPSSAAEMSRGSGLCPS